MDDQPAIQIGLINHHPNGLSSAIQMDDKPVSNKVIHHQPNGLSAAIQMDYQPLSKWMINLYQT